MFVFAPLGMTYLREGSWIPLLATGRNVLGFPVGYWHTYTASAKIVSANFYKLQILPKICHYTVVYLKLASFLVANKSNEHVQYHSDARYNKRLCESHSLPRANTFTHSRNSSLKRGSTVCFLVEVLACLSGKSQLGRRLSSTNGSLSPE